MVLRQLSFMLDSRDAYSYRTDRFIPHDRSLPRRLTLHCTTPILACTNNRFFYYITMKIKKSVKLYQIDQHRSPKPRTRD